MTTGVTPRVTSLAPQFLVDDLDRSMAYYRDALGFRFGKPGGGFYAIGRRDGLELHLKEAPKNPAEQSGKPRPDERRIGDGSQAAGHGVRHGVRR